MTQLDDETGVFKQLILKEIFVVVFFSVWIFCFFNLFLDDVWIWKELGPQGPLTQRLCAFSLHPSLSMKWCAWEPGDRLSEMQPRRGHVTKAQVGLQWLKQESHYNKPRAGRVKIVVRGMGSLGTLVLILYLMKCLPGKERQMALWLSLRKKEIILHEIWYSPEKKLYQQSLYLVKN